MGLGYALATFLSPIYAGWIFDRTESYDLVLITFSVILAFAAFFFFVLSPPIRTPAKGCCS
jgi:cyanate permease